MVGRKVKKRAKIDTLRTSLLFEYKALKKAIIRIALIKVITMNLTLLFPSFFIAFLI